MTRITLPAWLVVGCLGGTLALAQPVVPQVRLLGRALSLTPPPEVRDGVLLAPWGAVGRAAGLTVTGDVSRGLRLVSPQHTVITLQPGPEFQIGGQARALPLAAGAVGDDIVAPLKPLCEALEWILNWNPQTRQADLWGRVQGVLTRGDEAGVVVSVVSSLPAAARITQLDDPVRTVVDLPGLVLGKEPPANYVNLAGVMRVRAGQFAADPPVMRLVADLAGAGPRGNWTPRPGNYGGQLTFGQVQGDEPVIARRQPQLLKVVTASPNADTAVLTATFSDPVQPLYDVLRQPYRVLLDLCGADTGAAVVGVTDRIPFLAEIKLLDQGRLVLYMKEMVPFTVRTEARPDRLVVTFKRDRLAGKTIVVDAGHGGKDSGARGRYLLEKNINLDVARRTAARLMQLQARPLMTRDNDTFVELYDRPRLTNALRADLFVSIHCNAFKPDVGSGTQTYFCTPQSKALAVVLHEALWPPLGRKDGGVHQARFCVIRETQIPAVLVELLFIDNKVEENLLAKPEVRQQAAAGICEGLRRYVEGTASLTPGLLPEPGELPAQPEE